MVVKETLEVLCRSTSSCCSSHFKVAVECVPSHTSDDENAEPGKSVSALTLDLVEKDTQDARAARFSISTIRIHVTFMPHVKRTCCIIRLVGIYQKERRYYVNAS